MRLNELIRAAAAAYPDEYVLQYWDVNKQCAVQSNAAGDTLAEFVAWELYETFDPEAGDDEQITTALKVMRNAVSDLQRVTQALERLATRKERNNDDV